MYTLLSATLHISIVDDFRALDYLLWRASMSKFHEKNINKLVIRFRFSKYLKTYFL